MAKDVTTETITRRIDGKGWKDDTLVNEYSGFTYMTGKAGNDKYIIKNLAKSWTTIDDKEFHDTYDASVAYDKNDSLILENMTSKDVTLFFDVYNPDREGKNAEAYPDDGLYVIKKSAVKSVLSQLQKLAVTEDINSLKSGAVDIPYFFGNNNNIQENGNYGSEWGGNYINTIQTVDKKGLTSTLDVENYINTVKSKVIEFLKRTGKESATDALFNGTSAEKNELINIYKNTPIDITLNGTDGNDVIKSGAADDTIIGGKGNDKIYGEAGKNTLTFSMGDGNDTVYSGKGDDTIKFTDAESFNDLKFSFKGKDLIIKHGNDDSVTISGWMKSNGKSSVNDIAFSNGSSEKLYTENKDGTLKLNDKIQTELYAQNPYKKAKITGSFLNDKITGTDFNDTIKGGAGHDTIIGGAGNDKLYGEAGNNKFEFTFNGKDGFGDDIIYNGNSKKTTAEDTLVFSDSKNSSFSFDDLSFFKTGNDLKVTYNYEKAADNQGSVTVKDYYKTNIDHSVKTVEIGGKTTTLADLLAKNGVLTEGKGKINGTNGDDVIFGSDKKDTINSLAGNDIIYTGKGNDTIVFNTLGKDVDHKEITSDGGMNTLQMSKWNVLEEELEFSYNKNEKSMTIRGFGQTETNGNDEYYNNNFEVKINNFNNDYTIVDNKKKKYSLLAGEGNINGTKGNDIIISTGDNKTISTGSAGDNYVTLMGKNNIVNIGAGNTEIYHTDANGKEIFEEGYTKKNSNDTYNVNVFNKKTSVAILGDNDGKDTLNINGSAKDMRIIFNVNKDGSFNTDDNSLCIYHKSSSYNKFADLDSWFLPGIEMDWDFGGSNTIETINARGQQINMDAWIDAVKTDVASWLDENGYGSTEEVIGKENNAADIKALLNVYQQFDGAKYLM